jgi:GMP synthase (glutamine-hydrolysing)
MPAAARILIADGCPAAATEETVRFGGRAYGENYADALTGQVPGLEFFVLGIAEGERLPQGVALADFDGVAWTGSPLSAYEDAPAVTGQIALARSVFEAGVPCFGSCWGLQIMCAALGGEVRANPRGYEIGFARNIRATEAGRGHAMFAGKAEAFDAIAIHRDEVTRLPAGATVLAANAMSEFQAVEIADGTRNFWGVQYHPEFDLAMMAALLAKREDLLIRDGFARTRADVQSLVADLRTLHTDPARRDIAWRYGLGAEVLDPVLRRAEFRNWLGAMVLPKAAARAAAA